MDELEIIPHQLMANIRIFVNRVDYRSPHYHPDWELLWILDAPLTIGGEHRQQLVQPGELVLLPPNFPHELNKLEGPCTFLCIQIAAKTFPSTTTLRTEEILPGTYLTPEDQLWLRQTMLDTARALWLREPHFDLYCGSQCGLLLHRLLCRIPSHSMSPEEMANTERKNALLMRLIQFVEENYMHKIRLADFARREGKSVSYMSRFVKEALNQTFQEYVNSVRFNCARKLIAEGNQSMISISVASGFSDYRYFSRAFQEAYGMTPAEYSQQSQVALPGKTVPVRRFTSQEEIFSVSKALEALQEFRKQLEHMF